VAFIQIGRNWSQRGAELPKKMEEWFKMNYTAVVPGVGIVFIFDMFAQEEDGRI
jgi:hypothetical protein